MQLVGMLDVTVDTPLGASKVYTDGDIVFK